MHVSVVICTRNRADLIGNAVTSVLTNTYPNFDVAVIDQSDDCRTGDVVRGLASQYPNLRYVHTTTPGLSRAYNRGILETTGEVLAFTDDDCVAPPDWIESIMAAFRVNPDADLLYGQVLLPAALVGSPDVIPTLVIRQPERLSSRNGFRITGMGANFAAQRRLFDKIGGFDEVLGGGGALCSSQDFDLHYRAYRIGATIILSPTVKVDHYGARTHEQWASTLRAYGIGDGAFYFKHVRCGDLFALRLLIARLSRLAVREALNGIRRKPSFAIYWWSCLEGIRRSLCYPVDRQLRLYQLARPTP